jgi:TrpR-related protein YerC/YecD
MDLFDALLSLKNRDEAKRFLKDLCTPKELNALMDRFKVCLLLDQQDLSYREIQRVTKASLTTIVRVARFLREEKHHGYRLVLDRNKKGRNK